MDRFEDAGAEHQRRRWMRPNAHLYIRHDAHRFMPPGSPVHVGRDVVKYFWPEPSNRPSQISERKGGSASLSHESLQLERQQLLRLKSELAALRVEIRFQRFMRALKAYDPNQPRVPAGSSDGGQWTSGGGSGRVRLVAGDKPRLGPHAIAVIAAEAAKRAIEAFRKDKGLLDLFGSRIGTVTYTEFNGENIFGSNSSSPTYTRGDRDAAVSLRDRLLEKYPDVMNAEHVGQRPNDALFHAETTALLRAARANGGTLAGQTLEVHSDRPLCRSCRTVLPYVGLDLGNPTVTFIDPSGLRQSIQTGKWVK